MIQCEIMEKSRLLSGFFVLLINIDLILQLVKTRLL
jgi:hypothetical protein